MNMGSQWTEIMQSLNNTQVIQWLHELNLAATNDNLISSLIDYSTTVDFLFFTAFIQFYVQNHTNLSVSLVDLTYITDFNSSFQKLCFSLQMNNTNIPEIQSFYAVSGDKVFHDYHEYALHRLDLELTRRQKLRPDLTKERIFELMNGLDSESIAYLLDEFENEPAPDTSNVFRHKGKDIDVTKLSEEEIFHYLITVDETEDLLNLEHVRTIYHVTTPNEVLHYPEPFTASASFIHDDLHFLHILHYQFWLWFFFIFLIVFFFISFLCTVRWCQLRNKPRRETRGVSRSKCGDLITAIVPVTWAISIIVGESTDASDTYDGFATNEIMIGVRAYQWGWEYFYPKDVNLQYNVKPSYSTFVGNSLKYNPNSSFTLKSNALWKQYQKKELDHVITPAHLLVLPVDNQKMFNFLNFNDIGATTSNKSTAFKKIRLNSKVFTTNLIHTPEPFLNRYNSLNKLLTNETRFLESSNYGLKRQHNLTAHAAVSCNNTNFMDSHSFSRFLDHSCHYNNVNQNTVLVYENPTSLKKKVNSDLQLDATQTASILSNSKNLSHNQKNVMDHTNFLQLDIDNSTSWSVQDDLFLGSLDSEAHDRLDTSLSKVLSTAGKNFQEDSVSGSLDLGKSRLKNLQVLNSGVWAVESTNGYDLGEGNLVSDEMLTHEFRKLRNTNYPLNYRNILQTTNLVRNYEWKASSPDKAIITSEQSIRYQLGNNQQLPKRSNLNHSGTWNALQSDYLASQTTAHDSLENTFLGNLTEHQDLTAGSKILSSRFYLPAPLEPIVSNNPYADLRNYDDPNFAQRSVAPSSDRVTSESFNDEKPLTVLKNSTESEVINILQGKKEGSMEALSTAYWSQFWANSNLDLRVDGFMTHQQNSDLFYLPNFTVYYDYDFRNDQAIELLEEAFWETSYSSYSHLDYLDISDSLFSSSSSDLEKNSLSGYYRLDRDGNVRNLLTPSSKLIDALNTPGFKDLSVFGRYYSNQVQSDDFFVQPSLIPTKDFLLFTFGESDVLYDDSYNDYKNQLTLLNLGSIATKPFLTNLGRSYSTFHVLNSFRSNYEDFNWYNEGIKSPSNTNLNHSDLLVPNTNRFTTYPSLRLPAKNSITTFNALQKVFRTRFDEGRMNAKTSHFGNMEVKQPFVSGGRLAYEKFLGKNKESFFTTATYTNRPLKNLNSNSSLKESFKYPFYDFPFLLSEKSEAPMYMWFDWFAKWRWIDVQPVITGKYTTLGVPAVRKYFDYNVDQNSVIGDADLYTTRISRARHNYLPNWVYTPYLYGKLQIWNKRNFNTDIFYSNTNYTNLKATRLICEKSYWIWQDVYFQPNLSDKFTPSISGDSIHQKSTWRPYSGIQAYYYNNSLLVDLLTKREYLYRIYFEKNRRVVSLPKSFTTHPQHPLIRELKASFQFVDPTTYGSSYSRETYYHSLSYFKFLLLKNVLLDPTFLEKSLPINTKLVHNYLFYYFFGSNKQTKIGENLDLYKSQFRPLKKGITTMLRLHGTGAVAMPIEMRLRILASSRDIIHSWSVPSAGIKIDCIPGYTSHRIMTFMTPGIYWGQCQEICGRYHHWMPIICYFMKRDLFFLWCTHFIFKEAPRSFTNSSARHFNDYVRFASYDKSSWLNDIVLN